MSTIRTLLRDLQQENYDSAAGDQAKAVLETMLNVEKPEAFGLILWECARVLADEHGYTDDLGGTATTLTPLQELVAAAQRYWVSIGRVGQQLLSDTLREEGSRSPLSGQDQLRYSCTRVGYWATVMAPATEDPSEEPN